MAYFKLSLVLAIFLFCQCHAKIDPELLRDLNKNRGSSADILVDFKGGNSGAIQKIQGRSFRSRESKVKSLTASLQSAADESQGPLKEYLEGQGVQSESFWSSNQMAIRNADLNLVKAVDSFPQVASVQRVPSIPWPFDPYNGNSTAEVGSGIEWGIELIGANQVWAAFNATGAGVVVANIDSGVRGTHEALRNNFRRNRGWFDPYRFTKEPNDGNGHGTHTMGTILGQFGIGVAPGATWIACKGCSDSSCDTIQLLMCGQWMLAPTHPNGTERDASMIPDIVSNSWGTSRGGNPFFQPTIAAWNAAGIIHAFALGNSGPMCASGGSPGDQAPTFSVGSIDKNRQLSIFSSKGPGLSILGIKKKPEIVAPGSDVRSAWKDSDDSYNTISGTSMACPHVAGVMALMLSAQRQATGDPTLKLKHEDVVKTIITTAYQDKLSLSTLNPPCDLNRDFPNNQFGHGLVNAMAAVNATLSEENEEEPES